MFFAECQRINAAGELKMVVDEFHVFVSQIRQKHKGTKVGQTIQSAFPATIGHKDVLSEISFGLGFFNRQIVNVLEK